MAAGMAEPGPGEILEVDLLGRLWRLERAADLETLWERIGRDDFGPDERLPYWAELWPSSLVLGRWLHERRDMLAGRVCLDMGCGLGLTALVGRSLGARVAALDYEPRALCFARRNAVRNNVPQPLWTLMDWRRPAVRQGAAHLVWGADVMYEARFVDPVAAFLDHVLAPGGAAWMAEPGRRVYEPFVERMQGRGWRVAKVLTETVPRERFEVRVNVWSLARPGPAAATD